MARPIRSLTLPPGLKVSILASTGQGSSAPATAQADQRRVAGRSSACSRWYYERQTSMGCGAGGGPPAAAEAGGVEGGLTGNRALLCVPGVGLGEVGEARRATRLCAPPKRTMSRRAGGRMLSRPGPEPWRREREGVEAQSKRIVPAAGPASPGRSSDQEAAVIGRALGQYRLVRTSGRRRHGGRLSGARREARSRSVAVRVLPTGVLGDPQARKRFRRSEALALSRVSHQNIRDHSRLRHSRRRGTSSSPSSSPGRDAGAQARARSDRRGRVSRARHPDRAPGAPGGSRAGSGPPRSQAGEHHGQRRRPAPVKLLLDFGLAKLLWRTDTIGSAGASEDRAERWARWPTWPPSSSPGPPEIDHRALDSCSRLPAEVDPVRDGDRAAAACEASLCRRRVSARERGTAPTFTLNSDLSIDFEQGDPRLPDEKDLTIGWRAQALIGAGAPAPRHPPGPGTGDAGLADPWGPRRSCACSGAGNGSLHKRAEFAGLAGRGGGVRRTRPAARCSTRWAAWRPTG